MPEHDDTVDPITGRLTIADGDLTVGHLTPWPGVQTVRIPGGLGFRPLEGPAAVLQRDPVALLRIVDADGVPLVTLHGTTSIEVHEPHRLAEAGDRFRAALLSATGQPEPDPAPPALPLYAATIAGRRLYFTGPGPYWAADDTGRPVPVPPDALELVEPRA